MQSEYYGAYQKVSDWLRLLARSEIGIEIFAITNELVGPDAELVKGLSTRENCFVWLNEDLKIAFTVTDSYVSPCPFSISGVYDFNCSLMEGSK